MPIKQGILSFTEIKDGLEVLEFQLFVQTHYYQKTLGMGKVTQAHPTFVVLDLRTANGSY